MSPGLGFAPPELQNYHQDQGRKKDEVDGGLDLTLSTMAAEMASYPFPYQLIPSSTWDAICAATTTTTLPIIWSPDPSPGSLVEYSTRQCKRLKTTTSTLSGGGGGDDVDYTGKTSDGHRSPKLKWDYVKSLYAHKFWASSDDDPAAADYLSTGYATEEEAAAAGSGGGGTDGMRLVQQLIACAEAVACRDRTQASSLLSELRGSALVLGTSFQRVASCFVQGLADRLALVQPLGAVGIVGPSTVPAIAPDRKEEGLRLVYELCPYIQFGHFVANAAIMEAFEGESFVHVVDLGMTLGLPRGHQWRKLLHSVANRQTGEPPRRIRITGVGPRADQLHAIGDELEAYAQGLGLRLEFLAVESNLENLTADCFDVADGEVLAVNSMLQLHCAVKESRGALNSVLQVIHELSPKVLVVVEQDSSHNGPFFLGRFMEALHYYSAIFDSLDAMLPRYDTKRAKMEQFYFAEEIKNIVSCEGPARVERHERVDQWRRRMSRAGFQPAPIKMMAQAKHWLVKIKACEGYTIGEEKGCLVLGWKSKPIIAASCWKC